MQRINFNGVELGNGRYPISRISGLAEGEGEGQKINYIDTDGTATKGFTFSERIVTVEGHILYDNFSERSELRSNLIRAMNPKEQPKDFYYHDGTRRYYAKAKGDALPAWGDLIIGAEPFVCYISIPGFYLMSEQQKTTQIFRRTDKLSGLFSLPVIATERINQAAVTNNGDVATGCVITVFCINGDPSGIKITNITTGKYILLNHTMTEGETVKIDTEECTVVSSEKGNIINSVDGSSSFFTLSCGANRISAACENGAGIAVNVSCRYKYLGV